MIPVWQKESIKGSTTKVGQVCPFDKSSFHPCLCVSCHTKRQTKGWKLGWLPASNSICLVSCYNHTDAGKYCCKWWRVLHCNCDVQTLIELRQIYLDDMRCTVKTTTKSLSGCCEPGTAILQGESHGYRKSCRESFMDGGKSLSDCTLYNTISRLGKNEEQGCKKKAGIL